MKIVLAADHIGFKLKEKVKLYLKVNGIEVLDLGCHFEEPVDYLDFGKACVNTVINEEADRGIVICGTGKGISIAANKVKGIRCALCTDVTMAEMSRKHNNSNILALGGRLGAKKALEIVDVWLTTRFEGG
jgi:ribose 5-phosphate isomerase B